MRRRRSDRIVMAVGWVIGVAMALASVWFIISVLEAFGR